MKIESPSKSKAGGEVECIMANRVQQCYWWRNSILEDCSERLWCIAGYTYSTELAEKATKEKPKSSFKDIVPEQY